MSRRFFRHGELPLVLLALLGDEPMHGYELMSELGRLFGPAYRPSPGTVYPAIEALETEGLITGAEESGRTTYSVTPEGQQAIEARIENLAALELRTGARIREGRWLEPAMARLQTRLAPMEGRVDPEAVEAVLDRAATEIEGLDGRATKEAL